MACLLFNSGLVDWGSMNGSEQSKSFKVLERSDKDPSDLGERVLSDLSPHDSGRKGVGVSKSLSWDRVCPKTSVEAADLIWANDFQGLRRNEYWLRGGEAACERVE